MRILLAVPRHPHPPRRGDQLRTVQAVEALSARHEVTLLAPEPAAGSVLELGEAVGGAARIVSYSEPSLLRRVREVGRAARDGLPLQAGLFAAPGLGRALERHAPEADCVILQLVRLAPFLDRVGDAPLVVDLIDSLALSTARRAELDRPWMAPALRMEAHRLERWERRLAERAERTLVVSERDRDALAARLPPEAAERVRVVPVAVASAGNGGSSRIARGGDRRPVIAMTGNLGYFPTREGLRWFLDAVWPRLRKARPEARLILAGSRPPRWLLRLDGRDGIGLRIDPPDLRETLAEASVALAPMRCGAGQPLKVLEAWAASVPVVATSWTAAGAGARPGDDLMVADDPDEWLGAILALLDDPERAGEIVARARRHLARRYSADAVRDGWSDAVSAATAATRSRA